MKDKTRTRGKAVITQREREYMMDPVTFIHLGYSTASHLTQKYDVRVRSMISSTPAQPKPHLSQTPSFPPLETPVDAQNSNH